MEIEDRLKELIELKSGNVKAFATDYDIPYTTLRSILERGIMNAKAETVFAICKALNIKPEALVDESYWNSVTNNIVHGNNHGVNGLSAGGNSTNTYNFGDTKKQDDHNESIRNLSAADVKLQRQILNRFDRQLTVQEETNRKLDELIKLFKEKF